MSKKRPIGAKRRPPARLRLVHRICSWCGRDLGLLPYSSRQPSYGICEDCVVQNFAYLYEPPMIRSRELGSASEE